MRHAIDPSGEVLDHASPALRSIRDRLRQKRQRLRTTLDQFVRGKDTSKYLQEQVVTERNGRYVLMVRAEHRGNVPGIVHGSSASGASLFLEPSATVEINNDIVELEEQEREEIRRILLELTDAFRARPGELETSIDVAIELDVLQAKARFGIAASTACAPELASTDDSSCELRQPRVIRVAAAVDAESSRSTSCSSRRRASCSSPARTPAARPSRSRPPACFALMAQAGLHRACRSRRACRCSESVFADIGDEQSISASLSTFSAHITNIVVDGS